MTRSLAEEQRIRSTAKQTLAFWLVNGLTLDEILQLAKELACAVADYQRERRSLLHESRTAGNNFQNSW